MSHRQSFQAGSALRDQIGRALEATALRDQIGRALEASCTWRCSQSQTETRSLASAVTSQGWVGWSWIFTTLSLVGRNARRRSISPRPPRDAAGSSRARGGRGREQRSGVWRSGEGARRRQVMCGELAGGGRSRRSETCNGESPRWEKGREEERAR